MIDEPSAFEPVPSAEQERIRREIDYVIETQGWITLSICPGETRPGFTCTAGMGRKGVPEIIVFGLDPELARPAIARLARAVIGGRCPPLNEPVQGILDGSSAVLVEASHEAAAPYMEIAAEFCGVRFRVLQLIWPDPAGRFPWEIGFEKRYRPLQLFLSQPDGEVLLPGAG